MGGWALVPVIGTGVDDDAYRGAIAGEAEGDRIEYAALDRGQGLCLTAYDAQPSPRLLARSILKIADLAELDATVASLPKARRDRLKGEATNLGADSSGRLRDTIQQIGRRLSSTFDEALHLGQSRAPMPGSFVEDTFTDSDSTTLASHTGETGASWTQHGSYTRSSLITSNRLRGDGDTGQAMYYASGLPASADYDVAFVIRVVTTTVVNDQTAVHGRLSTSANTSYMAGPYQNGGAPVWRMQELVAGVATVLGSYSQTVVAGIDYPGVLELRGTAEKLYLGGTERISATSSAVTGAGRAGTRTRFSTATTGYHLASITATDAPSLLARPLIGRQAAHAAVR